MTDVQEVVQRVEDAAVFKAFKSANPHVYLVHAFSTGKEIELGYYGRETDKIAVFKTNPVAMLPPEEVFKQHGELQPLDLATVQLGLREAIARAEEERAKAYPYHSTTKYICILQQQNEPLWNITLVTNTLQMINMKISAQTGDIRAREMRSIMDLARDP